MNRYLFTLLLFLVQTLLMAQSTAPPAKQEADYRDLFSDTWVATDALGRTMLDARTAAGPVKKDKRRVVGILYVTWHGDFLAGMKSPYAGDVTKVLAANPEARTAARHPAWKESFFHWGEPELNEYDLPDTAYVPWLKKKVAHPEGYGIYFQERWEEALKSDPEFLYLNDWNEWTAGKYQPEAGKTVQFMRRDNPFFFVDQYNSEFNRTIQPMKGGYTDNYYMQMAQNIRRYTGVRTITGLKGLTSVKIDGRFDDWEKMPLEYRDTRGDVFHRSHKGYAGTFYTDSSGRNDIVTCKVAVDKNNIFFYAKTAAAVTPSSGKNWMLLFIDADNNPETGWHGYDYLVNKKILSGQTTTLMRYDASSNTWREQGVLQYRVHNNALELALLRDLIKLTGNSFVMDYHWSDNAVGMEDLITLCTTGDNAPNRRFNYLIWKK